MKRLFTIFGLVLAMSAVAPVAMAACGNSASRNADTTVTQAGKNAKPSQNGTSQGQGKKRARH